MEQEFDVSTLAENDQVIANNQVLLDQKVGKLEAALTKALDHLTPKEEKELLEKKRNPTVEDVENLLKKQKDQDRLESQAKEQYANLTQIAQEKLDTSEETIQALFKDHEIEYSTKHEKFFDRVSKEYIADWQAKGSKVMDWEDFNRFMKSEFQEQYDIAKEDEDEKPQAKRKEAKPMTGLNEGVSFENKKGDRFDKIEEKLAAHNRVLRGTPKAGDVRMDSLELNALHSEINRAKNKRMAEVI